MTNFELAKKIRVALLRITSQCIVYTEWSDKFVKLQLTDVVNIIKNQEEFKPINPSLFNYEELEDLGFERWSDDSNLMLIPLWLYPFLTDSFPNISISGKINTLTCEMDTGNHFGLMAYGV